MFVRVPFFPNSTLLGPTFFPIPGNVCTGTLFYDFGPFFRGVQGLAGPTSRLLDPARCWPRKSRPVPTFKTRCWTRGAFLPQSGHVPTSGGGKTQLAPRWKAPENAFSHPGCWTGILRNILKRLTRTNICVRPTRTNFRKWFLVHKKS